MATLSFAVSAPKMSCTPRQFIATKCPCREVHPLKALFVLGCYVRRSVDSPNLLKFGSVISLARASAVWVSTNPTVGEASLCDIAALIFPAIPQPRKFLRVLVRIGRIRHVPTHANGANLGRQGSTGSIM